MTPCSNDHPPILHDEFFCPLCCANEDLRGWEDAVSHAESTIAGLEEHIDTLDLADAMHALAAAEEAEKRARKAEQRYSAVEYAASIKRGTLTARLGRIDAALAGRWH